LIQNKNEVVQLKKENNQSLFSALTIEVSTKVYLLPEFKKVDFFLKIENTEDVMYVSKMQALLNSIEGVSATYVVDTTQIKSKNNLIF
jgi:hypothetical protein